MNLDLLMMISSFLVLEKYIYIYIYLLYVYLLAARENIVHM